ncbi:MAG: 50S ribosomal protein L19e [Candidatus Aenigmarchaeota archaeon]|nr:50S ribosomal protein L19e [Candidatus Aenigmarchaeota archaeon]
MNVRSQKMLAAKIMKVGLSRVRINPGGEKEVGEAITRNDVRGLIAKGIITKVEKKGARKTDSKFRRDQKKKGRRKGHGSRKGAMYARKTKKREWIEKVRPLRKLLRELRDSGKLERNNYRRLYLAVKGGSFRNKKHLLYHLKEHELLKKVKKEKATKEKKVKK